MVEYWKATKRSWCTYCKMFFVDNKLNRKHHEGSSKHQENLKKHVDKVMAKGQHQDAIINSPQKSPSFYAADSETVSQGVGEELVFGGGNSSAVTAAMNRSPPLYTTLKPVEPPVSMSDHLTACFKSSNPVEDTIKKSIEVSSVKSKPSSASPSSFEAPQFGAWVAVEGNSSDAEDLPSPVKALSDEALLLKTKKKSTVKKLRLNLLSDNPS